MRNVTRISTIAAAFMLAASPVLAQTASGGDTTALDNVPTPGTAISGTNTETMMSEGAYGIFYDEDGTTMRSPEDARAAYDAATDEDREMVDMACADWEEEQTAFLDSVSTTCLAFSDPE